MSITAQIKSNTWSKRDILQFRFSGMNLSGVNLQQIALLHYGKLLGMPQPDIAYIMSDSF